MEATVTAKGSDPPRPLKVGFWLLLGMLSTAFAEVVVGSSPYPFFSPWGILITTPLYTLHILVLTTILVRFRMLTWQGLCFAGALFGLYEAYITKVLFDPPWGQEVALSLGGVAWAHVVLLVLWWHPLMAFFVPLLVAETLLTGSRSVLDVLPARVRAALTSGKRLLRWVVGFAVGCGLLTSGSPTGLGTAVFSIVSNGLLLLLLIWLWRTRGTGTRYTMASLLPGTKGLVVCIMLLIVLYLFTGRVIRPESLPGMTGNVVIAVLYALLAAALIRCRAFYRPESPGTTVDLTNGWLALVFTVTYALTAVCSELILGSLAVVFLLVNWLVGGIAGLCVYGCAVYSIRFR